MIAPNFTLAGAVLALPQLNDFDVCVVLQRP
jgi:hypothetical protein